MRIGTAWIKTEGHGENQHPPADGKLTAVHRGTLFQGQLLAAEPMGMDTKGESSAGRF
jgi:hypothetical protein